MPIYNIPFPINNKDFPGWDINEDILSSFEVINNFENRINEIRLKNNFLRDLPIDDILNYFDSLAVYWLTDKRNEFLISSHHPLRETLMIHTGVLKQQRKSFIEDYYNRAHRAIIHTWEAVEKCEPLF